jgi:uncharacterized protein (TIGR00369 family)
VPARPASPLDAAIGLAFEGYAADGTALMRLDPAATAVVGDDPPFLHGGTLATCADTAAWYAVIHARPGTWFVSDLRVDFLRVGAQVPHRVTARCRRAGRTVAVVDVDVAPLDEPDRPIALGRVQLVRIASEAGG